MQPPVQKQQECTFAMYMCVMIDVQCTCIIYLCSEIYMYLCRLAWVDQKRRQVLYQRYIRATQVLYQLPIKTSGENRQMKQLGIFAVVTIE